MTISTNTTDDLQLVFQNLKSKARTTSRTSVQEQILNRWKPLYITILRNIQWKL